MDKIPSFQKNHDVLQPGFHFSGVQKGVDKIAKKTGEEAVELVIAAKNGDKEEIVGECADLFYHTLVLLADAGVKLSDVCAELEKRHQ